MGAFIPPKGQPSDTPVEPFRSNTIPNLVTFDFKNIAPPSPLYVQRDDVLLLQASNIQVGAETFIITGRVLLPDGHIQPMSFPPFVVNASSLDALQRFNMVEGFLLSVQVSALTAVARGVSFARLFLVRGTTTQTNTVQMLVADYVTGNHAAAWPGGQMRFPTEGPGNVRVVSVTQPGAGLDWQQALPGSTRWRLQAINAQLVTSATAGNRSPQIILQSGGINFFVGPPQQNVPASTTAQVSAGSTVSQSVVVTTDVQIPIPGGLVMFGGTIGSLTAGILAGDQWSSIRISVEEWIDNA